MAWIQAIMGVGTWSHCLWCLCSSGDYYRCKSGVMRTTKEQFHLCHQFYDKDDSFTCSGCKLLFKKGDPAIDKHQLVMNSKADISKYRASHFGHEQGKPPLMKWVATIDHIICTLHFLLRIVGFCFNHFIVPGIGSNDSKAKAITAYLHEVCHVCIPPLDTTGKGEYVEQAKKINFTGEEAWRTLINFDGLALLARSEADCANIKAVTGKIDSYFVLLYSEASSQQQRKAKSKELKQIGQEVITIMISNTLVLKDRLTPYLHAMVCAIPRQVLNHDILKLSGQALENLNQWRKRKGKTNNHFTPQPGQKGAMQQLMDQEQSRAYVNLRSKVKAPKHVIAALKRKSPRTGSSHCPITIKKQKAAARKK